jgi:hypothetical protein
MGGPKLTPAEMEIRNKKKQRYSALFQRIKRLFTNAGVKELLYQLKLPFSNYFKPNVSNLTKQLSDLDSIDPYNLSDEELRRKIIEEDTKPIEDVQVKEVRHVEDDTSPFPKIEQEEMKIEQTPQITEEMEHYENFEQSPEEIADTELMIREDRKEKLRKLSLNQHLDQETYYLINKQFEREIARHPPKNVAEKIFEKIIQKHL